MRNPVLLVMSILAGVNVILAAGALQELVSPQVYGWVLVASGFATACVQFWVRGQVTPVADPRDMDGTPLVRAKGEDPGVG